MSAIPRRWRGEGCRHPPPPWQNVPPVILAAAAVCGWEVVRWRGANDCGPCGTERAARMRSWAGNLFVTLAKQQVYGDVGLDGLRGRLD